MRRHFITFIPIGMEGKKKNNNKFAQPLRSYSTFHKTIMTITVARSVRYQPTHSVSGTKNNCPKGRSSLAYLRAHHVVINVVGIKT